MRLSPGDVPPVAEQPRLDLLLAQRLAQQRIVEQVDLRDRQVVRGGPVAPHLAQLLGRQRSIDCRFPAVGGLWLLRGVHGTGDADVEGIGSGHRRFFLYYQTISRSGPKLLALAGIYSAKTRSGSRKYGPPRSALTASSPPVYPKSRASPRPSRRMKFTESSIR